MLPKQILFLLVVAVVAGCSNNQEPQGIEDLEAEKAMIENTLNSDERSTMLIVRIKTNLSEEDLIKRAQVRKPQFEAIPGLLQKFYIKTGAEGGYGGVYIWDSAESLQAYRAPRKIFVAP
jgi:hypothetical protein